MDRRIVKLLGLAFILVAGAGVASAAETVVSLKFTPGGWDPAAWTLCRNPTVDHLGKWVQLADCVQNETPGGNVQALEQTLTTMVMNNKVSGNFTATASFEIGAGSAPGIILAETIAPDAQGRPQYDGFYEVIIYEKGLNLWHHFTPGSKPPYEKTAYADFALKPDTRYVLTVTRKGKHLELRVGPAIVPAQPAMVPAPPVETVGGRLGVLVSALPEELYVGVLGCEGVSRVYDFSLTK
jgi:hypothetical protein